ncbi:MAG: Gldg family protein [Crocinitomicaceae bacterium]
MSEKKSYKGIFNWTLLLIVMVGIIAINVISAYLYKRIDMTADQRYSLSSGTIKMLEDENAIKNRLTIRIYLEGTMPAEIKNFRNAIQDKLNEFRQYAGNRIEYKFIDPNQGTEEEQKELKDQLYNPRARNFAFKLDLSKRRSTKSDFTLAWVSIMAVPM